MEKLCIIDTRILVVYCVVIPILICTHLRCSQMELELNVYASVLVFNILNRQFIPLGPYALLLTLTFQLS